MFWSKGPKLPMDLAGHCLLNIGDGQMFLYGGNYIRTVVKNNTETLVINPGTNAWLYNDSAWHKVYFVIIITAHAYKICL